MNAVITTVTTVLGIVAAVVAIGGVYSAGKRRDLFDLVYWGIWLIALSVVTSR